jgi:hypothetical protein
MKTVSLLALIGLGSLAFANSSLAAPLASAMFNDSAPLLVEKVQAWSCRVKLRDMTIEQRRNCHGYGGPSYGYGYSDDRFDYGYPGYGLGVAPFFGFTFDDDDDRHRRRRHHRHHY